MRISEKFEQRLLTALGGLVSAAELREIDYEITAVQYPERGPDGSMSLALGMSVALACPTMAIGDQVLVTGVFRDPYIDDNGLRAELGQLIGGLRRQRAAANSVLDGGFPASLGR